MTGFLSFLFSLPLPKLNQNENENPNDAREQLFGHEDGGRKPDETPSALLSKERCLELLRKYLVLAVRLIVFLSCILTDDNVYILF